MSKAVVPLGDELARNNQMYMGHHGHVLKFPNEHGVSEQMRMQRVVVTSRGTGRLYDSDGKGSRRVVEVDLGRGFAKALGGGEETVG